MASLPSVSSQHRKRARNFNSEGGLQAKHGRDASVDKRQGSRSRGKRPVSDGKGNGKVRRKWRPNPEQKVFQGSANEGLGFALWRKKQVQLQYQKLLRKQKANTKEVSYSDHYPEHLKHLYEAEEERLKNEEKKRKPQSETTETVDEQKEADEKKEVRAKKKFRKKTSIDKAKEEYERVQRERAKKREEAENNMKKKEEAIKLYKQRKMETFKVLSSKTKKGQPNFNAQMEYLLKKIEGNS
ncbi:thyroid transcription factor 1-associated protein 26 [Anomaloglossus baeobatrachus]|uniref:thyroid transcription factor 1-associated protein 26 n=1 Tax=Anomaloglossus baeobatrachus TaxID=238106 RepID=UPI003F506EF1